LKTIYLDHAATTYVRKDVLDAMLPYFTEKFGNPSSLYDLAHESKKAIDLARLQVATAIGATPEEIYFTGGGSEADNLAIKGIARANKNKGNHIITSKIEHMAVLQTCKYLEREGFEVTYLDVDEYGIINLEQLKQSIKPTTILISIMFANNEIGTIQPIKEIGEIAKANNIYFHTDAVQAIGNVNINVQALNTDLLSLAAHKFYGPKGVGALYVRKGIKFDPVVHGGHQEKNKRAGTENVPGIVGLGKAIEIASKNVDEYNKKLIELRDKYIKMIMERVPFARLNGHPSMRLPGNANISFEAVEGESLLLLLSSNGICASSGSACTSGSLDPSHVLLAIGLPHEIAHGSLRVTFGEDNTLEDVDFVVEKVASIVERLRAMSPLWEKKIKK
jgi:cysteine desulfurase